jgi:hypothetical protein
MELWQKLNTRKPRGEEGLDQTRVEIEAKTKGCLGKNARISLQVEPGPERLGQVDGKEELRETATKLLVHSERRPAMEYGWANHNVETFPKEIAVLSMDELKQKINPEAAGRRSIPGAEDPFRVSPSCRPRDSQGFAARTFKGSGDG